MKLLQINAEFVENKFNTVVIRFTYKNLEDMNQDNFTLNVEMGSNDLLDNLDQEQTENLLRNFTEQLKEVLKERFHNKAPLHDPYVYHDEIGEEWLQKQYNGGINGNIITA